MSTKHWKLWVFHGFISPTPFQPWKYWLLRVMGPGWTNTHTSWARVWCVCMLYWGGSQITFLVSAELAHTEQRGQVTFSFHISSTCAAVSSFGSWNLEVSFPMARRNFWEDIMREEAQFFHGRTAGTLGLWIFWTTFQYYVTFWIPVPNFKRFICRVQVHDPAYFKMKDHDLYRHILLARQIIQWQNIYFAQREMVNSGISGSVDLIVVL